jgi:hypothetical protein
MGFSKTRNRRRTEENGQESTGEGRVYPAGTTKKSRGKEKYSRMEV